MLDITQETVTRNGRHVHKTKTHIEGLNIAVFVAVTHQYLEDMRLAVNRVGHIGNLGAARQ